ncbi:MAG: hypothetical protein E7523_02175 [Ruminococcaceae bacterium]|nr:hypothetical protein [Oscillospiraceae bacterium]
MAEEKRQKKKKQPHISTNIDFRITSPKIKILFLIIGLLAATLLGGYHVFQITDDSLVELETVTAKKITYVKSVEADAFVLRDECYIQGVGNTGYVVPLVEDGTKVSGNDSVVNIFRSESDAQIYYDLQDIEADIAYYESIRNTSAVSTLSDITAYDEKVKASIFSLIATIEDRNIQELKAHTDSLRTSITKKNIAVGNSVDVSADLATLYAERTQLLNKQTTYTSIPAVVAGYYVNAADGYESVCGAYSGLAFASDIEKITKNVKQIDSASVDALLNLKPVEVNASYGKLITGFIWYIVCNVPTEEVADFYIGQRLQIDFPDEQAGGIECKVAAMNADGTGRTALILSATAMDANYANLRTAKVVISLETYTGIRVDQTALRVVDEQPGVYVLLGNVIRFRNIEPIYSEEEFAIVDASGKSGYIKAFDEIILGGTDLYDGKLVQ